MQSYRKVHKIREFPDEPHLPSSDRGHTHGAKVRRDKLPTNPHTHSKPSKDGGVASATRSPANDRTTNLSLSAITAQEEERRRIARDLHDEAGQILTALRLNLETLALTGMQEHSKLALERSLDLCRQAEESVDKVIYDLRPPLLDDFGLVEAIDHNARSRLAPIGIDVSVRVRGEHQRLSPAHEVAAFRVSQESITNIIKHAKARHVSVQLEFEPGEFVVKIDDDGLGLDAIQLASQAKSEHGHGLLGMRERVELVGGTVRIKSRRGTGTRIEALIPYGEDDLPDEH